MARTAVTQKDELFVEYNIEEAKVIFKAIFEVKHKKSQYSLEALDMTKANTIARN